jgi:glycosyltransferase involved in cell wall biosynthesis
MSLIPSQAGAPAEDAAVQGPATATAAADAETAATAAVEAAAVNAVPAIPAEETLVPRVSIVIPAYNESDGIMPALDRIFEGVLLPCEVLVVVDSLDDTTIASVERYQRTEGRLRWLHNTYGRGPANAIRFGIDAARAKVTVVTMADGCDDPQQIDDLVRLVERGVAVAAASRYMPGGAQVGGPMLKGLLSSAAGRSLRVFARIGTRDATNSFKAYSTDFVRRVGIESRAGFEIGIELTAKARRARLPVAEIPTIWLDRQQGVSNFKLAQWIPKYLRWYFFAYGRPLPLDALAARAPQESKEKD